MCHWSVSYDSNYVIPFRITISSPGSGGVAETIADGYGYTNGGGGGGILIDGTGPGGGNAQHGEGYGAGAGGKDDNGFDGVVILEFIWQKKYK